MKHYIPCQINVFHDPISWIEISIPFCQIDNAILCFTALLLKKVDTISLKEDGGKKLSSQLKVTLDLKTKRVILVPCNVSSLNSTIMIEIDWLEAVISLLSEIWANGWHSCWHIDGEFFSEGKSVNVTFSVSHSNP